MAPNYRLKQTAAMFLVEAPALSQRVEAVEKVAKQILGWDVGKKALTECATINDLILGKGQVTPENIFPTGQKYFSYRLVRRIRNVVSRFS